MQKKAKICLNTMVANESHIIQRMLESCYKFIDYYVIQDNGSKDNTKEIITNFFAEKNIPGLLYTTEWQYPGFNRDHALQQCQKTQHGCDWILRIDADEILAVDDSFNWSILEDTNIQSYNILAEQHTCKYYRCWLWNAKFNWAFKHDKRHEIIYMVDGEIGENFQRVEMPREFRHLVVGDGNTWFNSTKFFTDALELERDLLASEKMTTDLYHLFYLAKSYRDYAMDYRSTFPFGESQAIEVARRSIFYFNKFLDISHNYSVTKCPKNYDENGYMIMCFLGECYEKMQDHDKALECYRSAEPFAPNRNEHFLRLAEIYEARGRGKEMLEVTTKMMDKTRVNPFPSSCFFIDDRAYWNSGNRVQQLHQVACMLNNIHTVE